MYVLRVPTGTNAAPMLKSRAVGQGKGARPQESAQGFYRIYDSSRPGKKSIVLGCKVSSAGVPKQNAIAILVARTRSFDRRCARLLGQVGDAVLGANTIGVNGALKGPFYSIFAHLFEAGSATVFAVGEEIALPPSTAVLFLAMQSASICRELQCPCCKSAPVSSRARALAVSSMALFRRLRGIRLEGLYKTFVSNFETKYRTNIP